MFEQVIGHNRSKNVLARMLHKASLPRSLCFVGPPGIGKALLGRQLAKVLLCQQNTGCGTCQACYKFDQGLHPDYSELAPEPREIKVDQIRSLVEGIHYRPFEARVRVVLIRDAECMGDGAANAFLKTLEEPPVYVHFLLVSSQWEQLLPTIRSRCQRIVFQGLRHADKVEILRNRFGRDRLWSERLASISFQRLETSEEAWQLFESHVAVACRAFEAMLERGEALEQLAAQVRERQEAQVFLIHLRALLHELLQHAHGLPLASYLRSLGSPAAGKGAPGAGAPGTGAPGEGDGQERSGEQDGENEAPNSAFSPMGQALSALARKVPQSFWRQAMELLLELERQQVFNPNLALFFDRFTTNELGLIQASRQQFRERLDRRRGGG
jgi:DNA polymerase-3 subunit delta'